MIPASRQRNYLQSALYVIVAGVCAAILLERLLAYAEAAEKVAMETTVTRLQAGLYARMALHALKNEGKAIEALAHTSPFVSTRAQAALPNSPIFTSEVNYLGEFNGLPVAEASGKWFYDVSRDELVYLPKLTRFLEANGQREAPGIRFKVELQVSGTNSYSGLTLNPVRVYRWEPLP